MSFRFWFLCSRLVPFLFAAVAAGFIFPKTTVVVWIGAVAVALVMAISTVGALLGVWACFRPLRMNCPYCGRPGLVGFRKPEGLQMECSGCGRIEPENWWSWRLIPPGIVPGPRRSEESADRFSGSKLSFRGRYWIFLLPPVIGNVWALFIASPNWLAVAFSVVWCGSIGAFLNGALRSGVIEDNAGPVTRRTYPVLFWLRFSIWTLTSLAVAVSPIFLAKFEKR